jgi:SnoaL-like protein
MTEDVVAIQQLLHRYCFLVDSGTPDQVASLFHETATLVPVYSGGPACKGRAAVREWYAAYDRDFRPTVDHLRHCVSNPLIEVQGNEATARCYLTADSITKKTGVPVTALGYYVDRLIKDGGRWYFQERQIHVTYMLEGRKASS